MSVPKLLMNTGAEIPQIGLGLWKMYLGVICRRAVNYGLEAGYRHFDTAQIYLNEQHLGKALADSEIPRNEVFITTKIWNRNQTKKRLAPSFKKSLKKLQTDYVDLLLLHFPVAETRQAAWPLMEEIHRSGQAKAIGVSNYMINHLEELLSECSIKPAVNQVELHVFLQQPELVEYCKNKGITLEAYSPLVHGKGMNNEALQNIAQKHGKSSAQIMLRWCIEKGLVPLPKSSHKERIAENIDIFNFSLDENDMADITDLNNNYRTCWDPTVVN